MEYTYKKRVSAYQERDETRRKRFQTNINKKRKLVYIDESGIDNSLKDGYGYSKKRTGLYFKEERQGNK